MKKWIPLLLMLLCRPVLASSGSTSIHGYVFGDFYWMARHHDADTEGRNGFWIRRIYLTLDHKISKTFKARLRFEAAQPGDFSTNSTITPFVKDAWLMGTRNHQSMILGISPTPTWDLVEHTWGYRAVEKTPLDLQKFGHSRDFGVAFKGQLGSSGKVHYHVMFANGSGNKVELNKGKKFMAAMDIQPGGGLVLQVYGDYESLPGDNDIYTLQGFLALKGKAGRIGVLYAHQKRNGAGGNDLNLDIASMFAVVRFRDTFHAFTRVDRMFDPNPKGSSIAYLPLDPNHRSVLWITGFDIEAHPMVHFMPNLEVVFYDGHGTNGSTPKTDIVPRLTFFYKF